MKKLSILLFMFLFAYACDPCKDVTCLNGGTCNEGDCVCPTNYTGSSCEIDMCASVNCVHGTCVAGLCQCNAGWTGALCDDCLKDCDHGECDASGDCDCDDGWEGSLCDECEVDCGSHGECNDDGECVCDDGWTGDECDEEVVTEQTAIAVWTSISTFPCNTARIDVFIDDNYEGYLDSYYTSEPNCGDNGTVTTIVSPGSHSVYAECNDGAPYWGPGTFSVDVGDCLLIRLTYDKDLAVSVIKNWVH